MTVVRLWVPRTHSQRGAPLELAASGAFVSASRAPRSASMFTPLSTVGASVWSSSCPLGSCALAIVAAGPTIRDAQPPRSWRQDGYPLTIDSGDLHRIFKTCAGRSPMMGPWLLQSFDTARAPSLHRWQEAGEAWGSRASDWACLYEHYSFDMLVALLPRVGVGPGMSLLDVACGSGLALRVADGMGADVAGIDAASELIAVARERTPSADLRVGSMFDLPWCDSGFDAVISINGIWGGCNAALDEVYRVLRPGGWLPSASGARDPRWIFAKCSRSSRCTRRSSIGVRCDDSTTSRSPASPKRCWRQAAFRCSNAAGAYRRLSGRTPISRGGPYPAWGPRSPHCAPTVLRYSVRRCSPRLSSVGTRPACTALAATINSWLRRSQQRKPRRPETTRVLLGTGGQGSRSGSRRGGPVRGWSHRWSDRVGLVWRILEKMPTRFSVTPMPPIGRAVSAGFGLSPMSRNSEGRRHLEVHLRGP